MKTSEQRENNSSSNRDQIEILMLKVNTQAYEEKLGKINDTINTYKEKYKKPPRAAIVNQTSYDFIKQIMINPEPKSELHPADYLKDHPSIEVYEIEEIKDKRKSELEKGIENINLPIILSGIKFLWGVKDPAYFSLKIK